MSCIQTVLETMERDTHRISSCIEWITAVFRRAENWQERGIVHKNRRAGNPRLGWLSTLVEHQEVCGVEQYLRSGGSERLEGLDADGVGAEGRPRCELRRIREKSIQGEKQKYRYCADT